VKSIIDELELAAVAAFVTNLNFIAKAHGVQIDSYSELFLAVDGQATRLGLLLNEETGQYDLHIAGVPL
jgi:hypothetical protein